MLLNDHQLFQSNPSFARNIDSRLHRDDHSLLELDRFVWRKPWPFMGCQSHAMPEGMAEIFPKTRIFEYS